MSQFFAADLYAAAKKATAADQARMQARPEGVRRSDWRGTNPVECPTFDVRDLSTKTKVARFFSLSFAAPHDLAVCSTGQRPRCIERIDLRAPDADARLARYEPA